MYSRLKCLSVAVAGATNRRARAVGFAADIPRLQQQKPLYKTHENQQTPPLNKSS